MFRSPTSNLPSQQDKYTLINQLPHRLVLKIKLSLAQQALRGIPIQETSLYRQKSLISRRMMNTNVRTLLAIPESRSKAERSSDYRDWPPIIKHTCDWI